MKILTIVLTLFLWMETSRASVIEDDEPFMEVKMEPVDEPPHSGGEQVVAKRQDSKKKPQKIGAPLNESDFYNAKFINISRSSPNGTLYKAAENPLLKAGLFEGDIAGVNISKNESLGKNAIIDQNSRWPSSIIPYAISDAFGNEARTEIARAIMEYHMKTCIRFVPRISADQDYLFIMEGDGCYSQVGRVGGEQELSLGKGCVQFGVIVHELMHAVGFWHEQSRGDRDDYVTILWDNIQEGMEHNFKKYTWDTIQALGEAYDYVSIMHYSPDAFARAAGQLTIVPKKDGQVIGQRNIFSDTDLRKVNALYKCQVSAEGKVTRDCADANEWCDKWAKAGECDKNPSYMRPWCMTACGLCGLELGCVDFNKKCSNWSEQSECDVNPKYMKAFCLKSCGVCT